MTAGQYLNVPGVARTTMDAVVAHYAASSVALPDTRLFPTGSFTLAAWDFPCVLVNCAGILVGSAPGGGAPHRTGVTSSIIPRHTTMMVTILRCISEWHGGTQGDLDTMNGEGLAFMTDMAMLSQALSELCGSHGTLKRAGAELAGDVVPVGPEGGMVACVGTFTVTAPGLVAG